VTPRREFPFQTLACTLFALLAFAGNAVLCRLALGDKTIDAASFTAIRLLSGIAILLALTVPRQGFGRTLACGNGVSALMLFGYAITFSYAYISLNTGVGALILFGAVQLTMLLVGIATGHRMHTVEGAGAVIAFSGLVYLLMPSVSAPSPGGSVLMAAAGIAWGIYSLRGRGSDNPVGDTSGNFLRTGPLIALLLIPTVGHAHLSPTGVLLAMLSGAITSGIGYTLWYFALSALSVTQAAVLQLLVPVIAALGGVLFAGERITLRLVIAAALVLGGILIVVLGRYHFVTRVTVRSKQSSPGNCGQ
jgi:drug/metabolite transporter (DMT)-like permease